jgi:hypothetical protein
MKSQKVGLTAVFFAFSLPMSALGQNSVGTAGGFLKEYDTAKAPARAVLVDGLGWANASLRAEGKQSPLYCEPKELALTTSQVIDILRRQVRRPPLASDPLGAVILASLQKVFPCTMPQSN